MNDSILKKGIQALRWEANYRNKNEKPGSNHFLAPATSLDIDFEIHLDKHNVAAGKALDVGTGTGEQAIFLSKKGFEVTATDVSRTVLENARDLAGLYKVDVNFIEDNILDTRLNDQFDLIVDRGCFTILPAEYKQDYFSAIKKLLKVNGWFFLKVDKKKNNDLTTFASDVCFKNYSLEKSSYPSINNKIIQAVVLVAQKVR